MSSESELKLLEDTDMEVPAETDAGKFYANVGSDEVLQPEQDQDIQDPEDLAPGDMEEVTESRGKCQFLKNNQMCVHRELEDCLIDLRTMTGDFHYHQSIK